MLKKKSWNYIFTLTFKSPHFSCTHFIFSSTPTKYFFLFFFKNIYCNSLKFPSFVKKSLLIQSFIELNRDQFVRSCEIEVSLHYTCFYAFSFVIIVCMLKQKKKSSVFSLRFCMEEYANVVKTVCVVLVFVYVVDDFENTPVFCLCCVDVLLFERVYVDLLRHFLFHFAKTGLCCVMILVALCKNLLGLLYIFFDLFNCAVFF